LPQIRQRFDRQGNYASCEGRIPVSELKLTIEEYGDGGRRTTDTATVGLITAGASTLVAITALVLNYRGFASIDSRLASMEARFTAMESRFEAPFASLQADLRLLAEQDKRITRLEERPPK